MAEIKSCKIEVLVFALPSAPVWIIRCPWGGCPWSVKFQCARLRVSPPSQATVSPSQSPSNDHFEGQWLAMSEPCAQCVPSIPWLSERERAQPTLTSEPGPAPVGMGRGSAVWCFPDVASRLEFLLGHLLVGDFGEISSFFPSHQ